MNLGCTTKVSGIKVSFAPLSNNQSILYTNSFFLGFENRNLRKFTYSCVNSEICNKQNWYFILSKVLVAKQKLCLKGFILLQVT